MRPLPETLSKPRGHAATAACLAVGAFVVAFVAIADPGSPYAHRTGVAVATLVTVLVVVCGAALSALVRLLSGSAASLGMWIRRSSVGTLLFIPPARGLTQTFLGDGWDFDDCGTLLAPYHPTGSSLAAFRSACDVAAGNQLIHVLTWPAVGCVLAAGYGLWLRLRRCSDQQQNHA
jgi:hypothetical protein